MMNRNYRSNTMKLVMAQCNHDVLYIIYVVFNKKALSDAVYATLKHMSLVKDYRAYKRLLKDLEESDLIKRKTIQVFDKYSKQEEIILKQYAIDYIAKSLNESPVAVAPSRTSTAIMLRTAKVLYLMGWKGDLLAKHGVDYWNKLIKSTTFFIAPNKTDEWFEWFSQYLVHFEKVPQIAENFANVSAFYAKSTQKFAKNLLIGSKSSRNKGLQANASPLLDESVNPKDIVVDEDVQKKTKENLLDDVSLHKILNNNIYLSVKKATNLVSTGKESSNICFKVTIVDIRSDAALRSYLLKLAYVHQFITNELLLDAYDVPFEVDFITMEAQQADNLQEALNALKAKDLERYGLMLPYDNGNVQISIKAINLRESLQKK